jgi:flagellar biosynthesis protein FliR
MSFYLFLLFKPILCGLALCFVRYIAFAALRFSPKALLPILCYKIPTY